MASRKEMLLLVLDQLADLPEISYRAMMGEYILYYRGKIVGGLYDDRLLVKPTASARRMLPDAPLVAPYEGAKEMLPVDDIDDREFLCALLEAMVDELPALKPKKPCASR